MAKLIERSAKKTCNLDPMPTPLVVNSIDSLLPFITKIINLSLSAGSFSDEWKCVTVNPLLNPIQTGGGGGFGRKQPAPNSITHHF